MDVTLQSPPDRARLSVAQVRLVSGLILFTWAILHFLNHALGLVSPEAMQVVQGWRMVVTRSLPGTAVIVAALTVHFALGMNVFMRARTWRLGLRSWVQLGFGLLIPVFMIRHVMDMRGVHEVMGLRTDYAYAFWAMWPAEALNQAMLMLLVWVHSCIGLHHWLVARAWYRRVLWLWYALAVLIPALSYAGFVTAARASLLRNVFDQAFAGDQYKLIAQAIVTSQQAYSIILAAAVGVWVLLLLADRLRPRVAVRYADGRQALARRGLSLLEISRANRIPHASVCGGRARCSTCRVRVIEGLADQPPASEAELQVLRRVGAPANVRLACQLRPTANLAISTLLPANIEGLPAAGADRYQWGVEQDVTLLFADLRGFTKMSEGRLPFDVVFLLNQFLGRMAEAIEDSGGFVDKFMGDGIMAIFGMDETPEEGARRALAAARAMGGVLVALNQSLREELPTPLAMGIGLHTGPAILGRIGATPQGERVAGLTALGETVNLASRLESLTKELGVQVIASAACLRAAGLAPGDGLELRSVEVRGLSAPLDIYAGSRATDLPEAPVGAA